MDKIINQGVPETGPKWTDEQLEAMNARDCNLLVAAAAGAGKTAVLVERIIRRITDKKNPVDIDRMLIVTFTNAAATEMRERIGEAISKELDKNPESESIRRQLSLLGKASIMTIHSFCRDVIKKHVHHIELDPGFRVADDTECTLMRLEALTELFEDQYEQENDDFKALLECYGGNRNDQALQDMVMNLYAFIQSSPWPDQWLEDKLDAMHVGGKSDFSQTPWGSVLIGTLHLELSGLKSMLVQALEILQYAEGLEKYIPVFEEELAGIVQLMEITGTGDGLSCIQQDSERSSGTCQQPTVARNDKANKDSGIESQYDKTNQDAGFKPQNGKINQDSGLAPQDVACKAPVLNDANESAVNPAHRQGTWDRLCDALDALTFQRLPNAAKNADKDKQKLVKDLRDIVKDTINNKMKKKLVNARSEAIFQDLETLYPMMLCLSNLVREFTARYTEKKRRKAILDFNDLEHLCLQILTDNTPDGIAPSKVAMEYRAGFDEIMVDEYQDSNMVQEILIKMISRDQPQKPNVFMVGDVKQSIYRFRQAKPELFLEKYNTYSKEKDNLYRKVLLFKNFRSRGSVLDAVNFIFKQIMSVNAGELDYTDEEALNPGAVFEDNTDESVTVGGPVEFHLIQTGEALSPMGGSESEDNEAVQTENADEEERNPDNEEEIPDNVQSEARLVALRILELMTPDKDGRTFSVFDKKKKVYRKVAFKDIVILLRATKNWSDAFLDELSMMGIPAFADTGTGFFKTIEIQVVLSLLQIIDNPLQDIPLLSVLRSPIFAFTTNELAELRLADRKALLFECVKLLAQKHPVTEGRSSLQTVSKKAAEFLEKLGRWRENALHMSTDQLLWYLYQDTGYFAMVGVMPAGEQRQANLKILYDRARQFEQTSYKGFFNFIHFIDRLKSSRGDMGSAKILGENDNVVRIMSIHKSKGLEFPVVFLAGCGKRFNLMDMNKNILLHQELGFGPDIVDYRLRISRPSCAKLAIREKTRVETLSEEMRILYVALTRAREKLIITGSVRSIEKSVAKWLRAASTQGDKLPDIEMLKSAGYLDWIGPALLRHQQHGNGVLMDYAPLGSEYHGKLVEDPSCWQVRLWDKNDVLFNPLSEIHEEKEFFEWLDGLAHSEASGYYQEIKRRLDWHYGYGKVNQIPAKVTVTELKRRFEAEVVDTGRIPIRVPALVKKPLFLEEEKGLSAAERGTVLHFVMQHLDYKNKDFQGQIDIMVQKDLLTKQQAQSVRIEKMTRFINSAIGQRLLAAKHVYREVPFNVEIPCHEIYLEMIEDEYKNETLLLQGIIDCYFEEPDGLVLLDYKTDMVPPGGISELIRRYRVQLDYYARTLEILTEKKVKERYIYLFSVDEVLEM